MTIVSFKESNQILCFETNCDHVSILITDRLIINFFYKYNNFLETYTYLSL